VLERRVENPRGTVVCVHGTLDRGGSFARVARRLSEFDVVAYDRRGYQHSRFVTPLGLELDVFDLTALVRHERDRGPVLIFGHSFGGVVALATAIDQPALLDHLVVFETPMSWLDGRAVSSEEHLANPGIAAERFFRRVVSDSAWERLNPVEQQSRRDDGPALLSDLRIARGQPPFNLSRLRSTWTYGYGDGPRAAHYEHLLHLIERQQPTVHSIELHHASHGAHLANPDQVATMLRAAWGPVAK
jgi:pimeloyl-ACP methyl ester carboxylesterase